MDGSVPGRRDPFVLFALTALYVLSVIFGLIGLVGLLPVQHLFLILIFALFSPLALCPYLRRRSPHPGRSQMETSFTSSKDNLQGDQTDEWIPILMSKNDPYMQNFGRSAYFIGSRLDFNTPKSWESWGLPKQMETPFTSSKDNLQGSVPRRRYLFGLALSALFVLLVLFDVITLVGLLPSRHLFLIFALFSPLVLCPYLRRQSPHRGRSQETSSKDNLQGDPNDKEIPILMSKNNAYIQNFGRSAYFVGSRLGFNTPKSWESWGLPKKMGTPFRSSKDNVQGDQNQIDAQQIDFPEQNETNRITQPCSGLLELSSSPDSCESSKTNRSPKSTKWTLSSICGMRDENNVPGKKKHDPSSCDSNRTPSSEVEKGAGLNKKEVKGVNEQGEQGPSIVQEFRDTLRNIKSCSEGLKQCLQTLEELLSRGELTQSLSPPHQDGNWAINSGNEKALGL